MLWIALQDVTDVMKHGGDEPPAEDVRASLLPARRTDLFDQSLAQWPHVLDDVEAQQENAQLVADMVAVPTVEDARVLEFGEHRQTGQRVWSQVALGGP